MIHKFVKFIPECIEEGVIYISTTYATATHNCCCGCKNKVVTPLSPTDWKLTFNGKSISLDPSIGNWSFKCQSHYWIKNNKVEWSNKWTKDMIDACRSKDRIIKDKYYNKTRLKNKKRLNINKYNILKRIKKWFKVHR